MTAIPPFLAERFEVVRVLGAGTYGEVLEVRDRETGDRRALKLLSAAGGRPLTESAEAAGMSPERVEREIGASMRVRHRHLVNCYEGKVVGGIGYLLLDVAKGTLEDSIRDPEARNQSWTRLVEACRGVSALHRAGLVHRDLKPANILIGDKGAMVSDLGLTKGGDLSTVTKAGMIMGTPGYLAPEQARGKPASPASDVFALGVMFYEVLEGRLPYPEADPVEMLRTVARGLVDDLRIGARLLDPRQAALVRAMLAVQPGARPTDLDEVAAALGTLAERTQSFRMEDLGAGPSAAAPPSASSAAGRFTSSREETRVISTLGLPAGSAGPAAPPGRGGRAAQAAAALALLLLAWLWFGSGFTPPADVVWRQVGNVAVVEFAAPDPREVVLLFGDERVGGALPTDDGRWRIVQRMPEGAEEVEAQLAWPGGVGTPVTVVAEEPAVRARLRLEAARKVRVEVLRTCRVSWADEPDAVWELEPGRHILPEPRGTRDTWTLRWVEEGIEDSHEFAFATLAEETIVRLEEAVGGVDMRAAIQERLMTPMLRKAQGMVGDPGWGEDPLEPDLREWEPVLPWIPDLLRSGAARDERMRLADLWNQWSLPFHLERDLIGVPGRVPDFAFDPGTHAGQLPPWPGAIEETVSLWAEDPGGARRGSFQLATRTRMNIAATFGGADFIDEDTPRALHFRWPRGLPATGRVAICVRSNIRRHYELTLAGPSGMAPRWVLRHADQSTPRYPRDEVAAAETMEARQAIEERWKTQWIHVEPSWTVFVTAADLVPGVGDVVELSLRPFIADWPAAVRIEEVRVVARE